MTTPSALAQRSFPRAADRREQFRDEAARIFAERGYHAASLQEIADSIGLTKASIYYYYKSKEELLFDILSFADEQIRALIAAQEALQSDPLAYVGKLVAAHVTWYLQHPNIAKVTFRDWGALKDEALAIQVKRRRYYAHVLRDSIDRCRREGLISADATVSLMANFINGAVAAVNVWFNPKGSHKPETVGKAFGDMAIAILLGARPPNKAGRTSQ